MKKLTSTITLLLFCFSLLGYAQPGKAKLKVTGKVIEKNSKQPLEYATITLKNTTNPIHRKVVPSMYQAILKETICASIRMDNQIIATGLGILDRDYIGIYAIHVKEEYRKHGYARQICTGLLKEGMKKGAQNAYLQVVEGNDNARALYRSLGFQQLYTYWFRVQPDENGNFPPEK